MRQTHVSIARRCIFAMKCGISEHAAFSLRTASKELLQCARLLLKEFDWKQSKVPIDLWSFLDGNGEKKKSFAGSSTVVPLASTSSLAAESRTHVGFLTLNEFTMIAFSSAIEVLRMANYLLGQPCYSWSIITVDGKPVTSSSSSAAQTTTYAESPRSRHGVRPAAAPTSPYVDDRAISLLRKMARDGVTLGGLCTGNLRPRQIRAPRRLSLHHPLGEHGEPERDASARRLPRGAVCHRSRPRSPAPVASPPST